jgi:hypothetical protein
VGLHKGEETRKARYTKLKNTYNCTRKSTHKIKNFTWNKKHSS